MARWSGKSWFKNDGYVARIEIRYREVYPPNTIKVSGGKRPRIDARAQCY